VPFFGDYPARLHHRTPGWARAGASFHLRLRVSSAQIPALTDANLAPALLRAARNYHQQGRWWCRLFLLMPDHLHAIVAFPPDSSMSSVIRDWKRATARLHRLNWQENYFDHRLRSEMEEQDAWAYIRRNPVVKGLCPTETAWPWWTSPADGTVLLDCKTE
jgi:REP element-mobilizing transposase RayT